MVNPAHNNCERFIFPIPWNYLGLRDGVSRGVHRLAIKQASDFGRGTEKAMLIAPKRSGYELPNILKKARWLKSID
jgi:hypothetical protein